MFPYDGELDSAPSLVRTWRNLSYVHGIGVLPDAVADEAADHGVGRYVMHTARARGKKRNPLIFIRCFVGWHRWRQIKVGDERGEECRDCMRRRFGTSGFANPNDPDVTLRTGAHLY